MDLSATSNGRGLIGQTAGRTLLWSAAAAAGLLYPLLTTTAKGLHQGVLVCLYGIVVYGLGFLYSVAGQLSVAHGALWGIGAYVTALLALKLGVSFWICLPIAAIATAAFAGLMGYPSLRVKGHYFLIMTFAFAEIARTIALNWRDVTNGDTGLVITAPPDRLGPIVLNTRMDWYYFTFALMIIGIFAVALLKRSALGKRLTAIGENDLLAEASGVAASRDKVIAFMISGVYAGIAGTCWAFYQHYVNPDSLGSHTGIEFILMLLIGGNQFLLGPIVGVIVAIFLPDVFGFSPTQNEIALGIALVAIILFMPQGVLGALRLLIVRAGIVRLANKVGPDR